MGYVHCRKNECRSIPRHNSETLRDRGYRQNPLCDKNQLKVKYLRFTVNVVTENDGSTVHKSHRKSLKIILQFNEYTKYKVGRLIILLYFLPDGL